MAGEAPKNQQAAAADAVQSTKAFAESAQTAVIKQSQQVKDKVVGAADGTKTSATEQGVSVKDKVVGAADDTKTTEQGVGVKDKVFGAVGSAFEATKTGVALGVDKAQSYFNPTTTTDDTKTTSATDQQGVGIKDKAVGAADDIKTNVVEKGVIVKDKVVGGADDTKTTSATEQGVGVKDKVFGAVGSAFDATKTGVAQGVDKAQSYFNPTTTTDAPIEDNKK